MSRSSNENNSNVNKAYVKAVEENIMSMKWPMSANESVIYQ